MCAATVQVKDAFQSRYQLQYFSGANGEASGLFTFPTGDKKG